MLLAQTNESDYEQLCRLDVLGLEDRQKMIKKLSMQNSENSSCEVKRVGTKLASREKEIIPPF